MQALGSSLPLVFPGNNREKIKHQWLLIPELDIFAQIIRIQFIRPAQNAPGNLAQVCACSWITLARHRPFGHFRGVAKTSHVFLTCHVDTNLSKINPLSVLANHWLGIPAMPTVWPTVDGTNR
jgi:hypothetical protein